MKDLNEAFVHLNVGLPDDVERLKAAGYYKEAVARIDEYLAEDWTETQNSPRSQGLEMPEYEQPANPVPHGVNALRDALLVQKEIMCRLPQEYCWNEAQAVARMLRDALPEKEVPGCRALCGISRWRSSASWCMMAGWTGGLWKGRSTTLTALPRR